MKTLPAPILLAETERYALRMAHDTADVRAAQRLRYEVFNVEMGEGFLHSVQAELDADAFDAVCDHLLVCQKDTGEAVGTYRLQTGARAATGLGYYSEQEFDFAPFARVRGEIVELGRACVAREHRNQTVLGLLWRGIAAYAQRHRGRYLVGCSSLPTCDPAVGLAVYRQLALSHLADPAWRTRPRMGLECRTEGLSAPPETAVAVPRLMSAYLALGARVCGEPALDREFGTVDFLTWLDMHTLSERVWQKFIGADRKGGALSAQ